MSYTEIHVIFPLMGLLLAVIAVQMMAEGILGRFPGRIHMLVQV
ncbi:MarC family protein [Sulfoacidibacillus ferrooxidans]